MPSIPRAEDLRSQRCNLRARSAETTRSRVPARSAVQRRIPPRSCRDNSRRTAVNCESAAQLASPAECLKPAAAPEWHRPLAADRRTSTRRHAMTTPARPAFAGRSSRSRGPAMYSCEQPDRSGGLALGDERGDLVHAVEIIRDHFLVFHFHTQLLLDEENDFQHAGGIDDAALQQRIIEPER